MWGAGAAALGTAGYFLWSWSSHRGASIDRMSDYDRVGLNPAIPASQRPGLAAQMRSAAEDEASQAKTGLIVGSCLAAAGVGMVVGGVISYVQGQSLEGTVATPVSVAPVAGPGVIGFALSGGF